MIPGYREEDMKFDHNTKFTNAWDSDFNSVYKCYLPHDKCEHDPFCIADALRVEIEKNSGDDPIGLVGLSFGGAVSQIYASKHPDQVKKLALIQATDMSRTRPLVISALKLNDVNNVVNINWDEIDDNIKSDTFVYNCLGDRILGGNPPNIKGAKVREDIYCIHGMVPDVIGSRTMRFINQR